MLPTERIKALMLQPRETWPVIASESATTASLYTGYLMLLALVPALCGFIGMSLVGVGGFGFTFRVPLLAGLGNMVVSYALSLAGIFVLGLLIDALAPVFGGRKSPIQALKVAVYASTAALLGGVFSLIPALAVLGLLAAGYSIFLLYTGLPVLMNSRPEKTAAYTAVVVVAGIVAGLIMAAASALFMPRHGAMGWHGAGAPSVTLNTPGGKASLDTAALDAASKKMEEATRKLEAAQKSQDPNAMAAATGEAMRAATGAMTGGSAVAGQSLKAALPESLAGLPRTGFQVQDGATTGLGVSHASAEYSAGEREVRLEISDLGALSSMAAMAAGIAQGERETRDVSEKTWQESGRTLSLVQHKNGGRAEFKAILKNGLIVSLESSHLPAAELRTVAGQLDLHRLETLARSKAAS